LLLVAAGVNFRLKDPDLDGAEIGVCARRVCIQYQGDLVIAKRNAFPRVSPAL
jgi:hypothetical protein